MNAACHTHERDTPHTLTHHVTLMNGTYLYESDVEVTSPEFLGKRKERKKEKKKERKDKVQKKDKEREGGKTCDLHVR